MDYELSNAKWWQTFKIVSSSSKITTKKDDATDRKLKDDTPLIEIYDKRSYFLAKLKKRKWPPNLPSYCSSKGRLNESS